MTPNDKNWYSDIEPKLVLETESDIIWSAVADVIIVGLGGAGVAAALESIEAGNSVLAIDKYETGGATKASGGVIYAGGGTSLQTEAGVKDSVKNMFNYLKLETRDIVSDQTLKDFCNKSAPTIDWLIDHGVDLRSTLWKYKTSYPAPKYFLYHSDNSLVENYRKNAFPAARGHRGYVPEKQGAKATNLGGSLFDPLKASAIKKGLLIHDFTEVRQLITNKKNEVIGLKAYQFNNKVDLQEYKKLRKKASKLLELFPPIVPGSKYFFKKAMALMAEANELLNKRKEVYIRSNKGIILSAGGFVFNRKMVEYYAPKYKEGYPLGTEGDNGSGIRLGQSVGGVAKNMDRMTAWRFINPPISFAKGMIVNTDGNRFINEMVYGATLGVEMTEYHNGSAWMILDKKLVKKSLKDVSKKKALAFQQALAKLNIYFGSKKANSITELAKLIGVNADNLHNEIIEYNKIAKGETLDPFGKTKDETAELNLNNIVAIDISLNAKLFPCPTLSLGGLSVNEKTGSVLNEECLPIKGLYAAGRNAVGVASWSYVSGLSIADCIYSGRRAATSINCKSGI